MLGTLGSTLPASVELPLEAGSVLESEELITSPGMLTGRGPVLGHVLAFTNSDEDAESI